MTRRIATAVALAASIVFLAACGTKSEPSGPAGTQHISLLLDFFPNADHAGIYEGIADGEFRRAGLDVDVQTPSDPSAPLRLLEAGRVDVAISYEPELMLARDKGAKLVSVAALVNKPLTSIIALGSAHLRSPADLEGHTVGTAGIPYQSAYLKTILEQAGADPKRVKEVNVGFGLVPAMLSKKVYATLGGFWNYEGLQLARRHKRPKIIRVDEAGVPTYDELIVVTRADELAKRGPVLRRFVQALALAHQALRRNPDQGIEALLAANKDLDPGLQRAAVRATLPVFFPENKKLPWGWQDAREWAAYGDWMLRNGLVKRRPDVAAEMTDDLLPGQGS